jgi:hypothetical protein
MNVFQLLPSTYAVDNPRRFLAIPTCGPLVRVALWIEKIGICEAAYAFVWLFEKITGREVSPRVILFPDNLGTAKMAGSLTLWTASMSFLVAAFLEDWGGGGSAGLVLFCVLLIVIWYAEGTKVAI